jgi:hypothetical protein
MDPDENLKEQLRLAKKISSRPWPLGDWENKARMDYVIDAARLAELVEALDGWLQNDGFLPRRWKTSHHP